MIYGVPRTKVIDAVTGRVAHGASTFTDSLHVPIRRATFMARASDTRAGPILTRTAISARESLVAPSSAIVLYRNHQSMLFRAQHGHW